MKDVFAVYDSKAPSRERRFVRVGVAFENRDGSLNVLLDALPLSGRLHIRPRAGEPAGEREPSAAPMSPGERAVPV